MGSFPPRPFCGKAEVHGSQQKAGGPPFRTHHLPHLHQEGKDCAVHPRGLHQTAGFLLDIHFTPRSHPPCAHPTPTRCSVGTMDTLLLACSAFIWPRSEQNSLAPFTQGSTWPGLARQGIHPTGRSAQFRSAQGTQEKPTGLISRTLPPILPRAAEPQDRSLGMWRTQGNVANLEGRQAQRPQWEQGGSETASVPLQAAVLEDRPPPRYIRAGKMSFCS